MAEKSLRRPNRKNVISYAVGDLYGGGAFFIIGSLFLVFLIDKGINAGVAGTIILIGKVWDAITDPTMGYISDNTRNKRGRRRVYFLIGILPIFLSWFLLWSDFGIQSDVGKFIYYLIMYLVFNTVFTLVMVPYNTMPSEMATEYSDRTRMITIRMVLSQLGMLLGALLPTMIVSQFTNVSIGYMVFATVFGLIFAIPWIFVYKGTYEQDKELPPKQELTAKDVAKKIAGDFGSTIKNKSLRVHTGMYLAAYVSMDIFMALLLIVVRDYIYGSDMGAMGFNYNILLGAVVIFQILSNLVVLREVNKNGNAKTYRLHSAIWMLAIVAMYFVVKPGISIYSILPIGLFIGFGLAGCVLTPYNMLAFVVDADELITTQRREGIYSGMMTFLRKLAQALALFLVGQVLSAFNYLEPLRLADGSLQYFVQSAETLEAIKILFLVSPLVLLAFGIISSLRFKITPENHTILMSEIDRLKQGGSKSEVTDKTKSVCEEITGLEYEKLYINPETVIE